ncbi:MAG: tetratricopeptide repeat protein [Candidatus Schekmanbacteria bacterium]|nr:tetratricopeptide repeat protein [Candidatus Schekmanbacteria bacterium]
MPTLESLARNRAALTAALFLLCCAAYASSYLNDFTYDDEPVIVLNPDVENPDLVTIFLDRPFNYRLDYRPLTRLVWALSFRRVNGVADPRPFHVAHLILHATVAVLLFAFLARLGPGRAWAWWSAALFGVHPVYSEAVFNASYLGDTLVAAGGLSAMILLDRVVRSGDAGASWRGLAAMGCAAALFAALLSKETAIYLLPALACQLWWNGGLPYGAALGERLRQVRRTWLTVAFWLLVTGLFLAMMHTATGRLMREQQPKKADVPTIGTSLPVRLYSAAGVTARYARLLVWPVGLSPDYSIPAVLPETSPWSPRVLVGAGLLAALAGGAIAVARRRRDNGPLLLLALFAFPYFLTSNIAFPTFAMAERYLYLPSLGLIPLVLLIASPLVRYARLRPRSAAFLGAALLAVIASTTFRRGFDWFDNYYLFGATVARGQASAKAEHNFALACRNRLALDRAIEHASRALALRPDYRDAATLRASTYELLGKSAEALADYDRIIELGGDHRALSNRGRLRLAKGDASGAEKDFTEALRRSPDYVFALLNRAYLYQQTGELGRARADAARAVEVAEATGDKMLEQARTLLASLTQGERDLQPE